MGKKPSEMTDKKLRKELAEKFGHDKTFLKGQPRERLTKILTDDRKALALVDEARTELIEEFGYDPESVRQQSASEIIRQRSLEQAGRAVSIDANLPASVAIDTNPPAPSEKPKRKSRTKKKDEPAIEDELIDLDAEIAELVDNQPEPAPSIFMGLPGVHDYRMDGHAGVGPSGAERWMSCTASLQASREFLETLTENQLREFAKANIAAREGTTAHSAAESKALLALGRIDDNEHEHNLLELANMPATDTESYDDSMSDFITEHVDLIMQVAQDRGHDNVLIEHRVLAPVALTGDHADEVYEVPGSADFVGLPVEGVPDLIVGDLKYGQGYEVEVKENKQERIYALGVLASLCDEEGNLTVDVETITYYVIQPRIGGISTWTESVEDLLAWVDNELAPALTAALYGPEAGAEFVPSDEACQWCPARGSCPALALARTEAATEVFDIVTDAEVAGEQVIAGTMDNDMLGSLLAQVNGLVDLQKDLKAEAQRRLHRGDQVPGFKLVSYTPRRVWDEDAPEELDEVAALWERKMLSPTQALLAVQGDDELTELVGSKVVAPDKRPIVAPEKDKRKEWVGRAPEDMFTDLTEEAGT